jgi:type II secretory pathway pseudopilin PulG
MRRHNISAARQGGAVLLLLLLVLSLGAASLLMAATSSSGEHARRQALQTQQQLAAAREALIGYAVSHGRLPRPAISALDGRESEQPCTDERSCTGFLPWTALGLAPTDAWGKLLQYSVTPAFTVAPVTVTEVVGSKRILARRGADLVYVHGYPRCEQSAQCLPAVVWSAGPRNLGTSALGVPQASLDVGNLDEQANALASDSFIVRGATLETAPGGPYSQQFDWVPIRPLLLRMATAVLPPPPPG